MTSSLHENYRKKQNATFEQRILAFVIDTIIIGIFLSLSTTLIKLPSSLLSLLYFCVLQAQLGYTPGKYLMGLRLISTRGHSSYWRLILRETIGKTISILFFGLGLLTVMLRKDRLAWHDQMSSTRVITLTPQNASRGQQIGKGLAMLTSLVAVSTLGLIYLVFYSPQFAQSMADSAAVDGLRVGKIKGSIANGFEIEQIAYATEDWSLELNQVSFLFNKRKGLFEKLNTKDDFTIDHFLIGSGRVSIHDPTQFQKSSQKKSYSSKQNAILKYPVKKPPKRKSSSYANHQMKIKKIDIKDISFEWGLDAYQISHVLLSSYNLDSTNGFSFDDLYIQTDFGKIHAKDFQINHPIKLYNLKLRGQLASKNPLMTSLKKDINFSMKAETIGSLLNLDISAFNNKLQYSQTGQSRNLRVRNLSLQEYTDRDLPIKRLNLTTDNQRTVGEIEIRNQRVRLEPKQPMLMSLIGSTSSGQRIKLSPLKMISDQAWLQFYGKQQLEHSDLSLFYINKPYDQLGAQAQKLIQQDHTFFSTNPFLPLTEALWPVSPS
jgi:uncharacterized RDD family membrane protein YckC